MTQKIAVENTQEKACLDSMENQFSLLDELITEILSWLPVESLLRFRCVCKSWCSTIEDIKFIEKHMEQASFDFVYRPKNARYEWVAEPYTIQAVIRGLRLEKCKFTKNYYIRNPSTKRVIRLPRTHHAGLIMSISFFSDTNEYKLVNLYLNKPINRLGCEVLKIGTDITWRPLEFPDLVITGHGENDVDCKMIDGVFYVSQHFNFGGRKIICMEMKNERFMPIDIPRRLFQDWGNVQSSLWNGKFSFTNVVEQELHVWILEDYKKQKWAESKIVLSLTFVNKYPDLSENLHVIGAKDDILWIFPNNEHVILLDLKSHKIKFIKYSPLREKVDYFIKHTLVSVTGMQTDDFDKVTGSNSLCRPVSHPYILLPYWS